MRTTTMGAVVTSTAEGAKLPATVDTKGRVRISKGQRGLILEEFERSGVSGAEFARRCGLKYSTVALPPARQGRILHTHQLRKLLPGCSTLLKLIEQLLPPRRGRLHSPQHVGLEQRCQRTLRHRCRSRRDYDTYDPLIQRCYRCRLPYNAITTSYLLWRHHDGFPGWTSPLAKNLTILCAIKMLRCDPLLCGSVD